MNNNMPAFRLFLAILAASANYAQALPTDSRTGGIVMPATPSAMVTDEKPANAEFRKGIAAQLKGEMAAAKKHFLTAVKLDEKFTPPLIGLADITLKEGNRIQAENYLRQAERTAPQAAEVHLGGGASISAPASSAKRKHLLKKHGTSIRHPSRRCLNWVTCISKIPRGWMTQSRLSRRQSHWRQTTSLQCIH